MKYIKGRHGDKNSLRSIILRELRPGACTVSELCSIMGVRCPRTVRYHLYQLEKSGLVYRMYRGKATHPTIWEISC